MICPQCNGTGQLPDAPDTGIKKPEKVMQPTWGNYFEDPVFGTKIRRMSDAAVQEVVSVATEYPTVSPWNADGTRLLLIAHDHYVLFDDQGDVVHTLLIPADAEARWHPRDPNWMLFHKNGNELWGYNQRNGYAFMAWKFAEYSKISGRGEADLSDDGLHLAFVGDDREVFVFNHETKKKTPISDAAGQPFDSLMLTGDNRVLVSRDDGIFIYGPSGIPRQVTRANGHKDICGGYLIWTNSNDPQPIPNAQNAIVRVDIGTGEQVPLIELPWSLVVHVSCSDTGLALISTFAAEGQPWAPFMDELFLIGIRGGDSPVVRRLAHHRSTVRDYTAQPRACISRDGKRVVFNSNFGGKTVDAYEIEL